MVRGWKLGLLLAALCVVVPCSAVERFVVNEHDFRAFTAARGVRNQTPRNLARWSRLAGRLLPTASTSRRPFVSAAESEQLFDQLRDARLAPRVVIDGCAPKADLHAKAIERAGIVAHKINRFSIGGGVTWRAPEQTFDWVFHMAAAVMVGTSAADAQLMVHDPVLFDRPVTQETWEARLASENGITVVTGSDQQSFSHSILVGHDRITQLAANLASVAALRRFEGKLAAPALVSAALAIASNSTK